MASGSNYSAPECDCRSLEPLSKEPSVPIEFDEKLNEYYIVGADGAQIMVYHCPFCGGCTPASRRGELFMHVTRAETERLRILTRDLKTLDDVLKTFGAADFDNPTGFGFTSDDGTKRPRTTYYRTLTFKGLSDVADVDAVVDLNNQVQFSFLPKEVGGASTTAPE